MKKILISMLISMILIGLGIGISIFEFMQYNYLDNVPNQYEKGIEEINADTDEFNKIIINNSSYRIDKVIDDNIDGIKVLVSYYPDYMEYNYRIVGNWLYIDMDNIYNINNSYKIVKKMIKDKEFFNLNELENIDITIYGKSEVLDKLSI